MIKVVVKRNEVTYMPNPKFISEAPVAKRKEWHDALIDGGFKQCAGSMYSNGAYCCLGVGSTNFVTLSSIRKWGTPPRLSKFAKAFDQVENSSFTTDWYDPYIAVNVRGNRVSATNLNDNRRLDFKQIAKLVYPEAYE